MTWEELQKQYPNSWAFIKNVKRNKDGDIIDFDLLNVCKKNEKAKYLKQYMQQPFKFECIRTTFNGPNVGVML